MVNPIWGPPYSMARARLAAPGGKDPAVAAEFGGNAQLFPGLFGIFHFSRRRQAGTMGMVRSKTLANGFAGRFFGGHCDRRVGVIAPAHVIENGITFFGVKFIDQVLQQFLIFQFVAADFTEVACPKSTKGDDIGY